MAQILAPRIIGHIDLSGRVERIDAGFAIAPHHDWAEVAWPNAIVGDQFESGGAKMIQVVIDIDAVDLGRVNESLHMVAKAENSRFACRRVATDAFKNR